MANEKNTTDEKPWFKDGLRFECTGCGDCCTGSPGYVWVNQAEIDAMAEHQELAPEAFEKKYVRNIGIRRSLIELPVTYDCVFLDSKTRKCQLYDARPRQCKTWPFWKSTTRDEAAWQETCEICPGSGKGKLYQLEHIEEQVAIVRV